MRPNAAHPLQPQQALEESDTMTLTNHGGVTAGHTAAG